MLTIDGSVGGGQVLRTALSLAAVTGRDVRVEDVRAERPDPGLKPQHRAAVELVADLCDAAVEGAEVDAETVTFRPGERRRRELRADVGTAGSVTLLFDAVLPVAIADGEPVEVTATGGTDVKWSPTVAYHRHVKLPLLARWGVDADVDLERTGFYPAGGGKATLRVRAGGLSRLELDARGDLRRVEIHSKAAESLEDQEVADRQATAARERLEDGGMPAEIRRREYVPADSPGSSILLRGVYERTLAGVDVLGERGVPSEEVAGRAVEAFTAFHGGDGVVDRHMADQALVALAIVGGRVRLPAVTDHVETNLAVLRAFGSDVDLARADGTVTASPLADAG